jgi:short-subunit dehydrogenase
LDAKTVAEVGYNALMQGKTSVVAGCANKLTVFSLRFTPRNMATKIVRSMMSRK